MSTVSTGKAAGLPETRSFTPSPDPTILTTQQLRHEQGTLREVIEARLNAMDIATRLQADHVNRVPSDIDKQIKHLTDLFGERMEGFRAELRSLGKGIQLQFDERDIRSRAAEDAAKVAVNAALQAQKEAAAAQNESNAAAITKSEGATVKQIDGILALLGSNTLAINDKIAGIISRLDRGEAIITTNSLARQDRRLDGGSNIAILGVGLMVITAVVGLIGFVMVHSGGAPPSFTFQAPPNASATVRP
jgi:NADH dehydrogenase/NADH:ubiquinone oxidoreductase subunit G